MTQNARESIEVSKPLKCKILEKLAHIIVYHDNGKRNLSVKNQENQFEGRKVQQ